MTDDPRFPEFTPTEKTPKATILIHLDYAHERQSRRDCYRWEGNMEYFLRKYTKKQLLEIHSKYHEE